MLSDKAWHPRWLDQLAQGFLENSWTGSYYIADSALMAELPLEKIRAMGMHWPDHLPTTLRLCQQLKEQDRIGCGLGKSLGSLA